MRLAAAAAMTFRPVAVEPVNDTRSTRGSDESRAPTPWSAEATTLSTPGRDVGLLGGDAPERASPSTGVSGAGLSTTVHPAASAGADLGQVDLHGEVPRRDRADHAGGLAPDGALRVDAEVATTARWSCSHS